MTQYGPERTKRTFPNPGRKNGQNKKEAFFEWLACSCTLV